MIIKCMTHLLAALLMHAQLFSQHNHHGLCRKCCNICSSETQKLGPLFIVNKSVAVRVVSRRDAYTGLNPGSICLKYTDNTKYLGIYIKSLKAFHGFIKDLLYGRREVNALLLFDAVYVRRHASQFETLFVLLSTHSVRSGGNSSSRVNFDYVSTT